MNTPLNMALWMRPISDRSATAPIPVMIPTPKAKKAEREQIDAPFFAVAGGDSLGRNGGISGR